MRACLLFVLPGALLAQDGAALFQARCAVPYCHGPKGEAGRAPKLIGHKYDLGAVFDIISVGIPAKGMPGFTETLKVEEINAIAAYVDSLAGSGPRTGPLGGVGRQRLSADVERSRRLFFDATRWNGCGRCHELDGWGYKIGPDLSKSTVENLRGGSGKGAVTARAGADRFPALVVEKGTVTKLWDLSSRLPVLRTLDGGEVSYEASSSWDHAAETRAYTDADLEQLRPFLRHAREKK
jgi:cytochrome c553